MKEAAIKEIKDTSIKIAVDSVKKIISTSVDKNKLDAIFEKDLEEAKTELKKLIHSNSKNILLYYQKNINYLYEFNCYWVWIWWYCCSFKIKSKKTQSYIN